MTDLQISFILHLYHPQYFQAKVIVFWKYKTCTKAYVNTKYIQTVKSATVQDKRWVNYLLKPCKIHIRTHLYSYYQGDIPNFMELISIPDIYFFVPQITAVCNQQKWKSKKPIKGIYLHCDIELHIIHKRDLNNVWKYILCLCLQPAAPKKEEAQYLQRCAERQARN